MGCVVSVMGDGRGCPYTARDDAYMILIFFPGEWMEVFIRSASNSFSVAPRLTFKPNSKSASDPELMIPWNIYMVSSFPAPIFCTFSRRDVRDEGSPRSAATQCTFSGYLVCLGMGGAWRSVRISLLESTLGCVVRSWVARS